MVGFIENSSLINFIIVFAGISAGASYGMYESKNVKMTGMPEMVAIFNGYGGLASLLISVIEYHNSLQDGGVPTMGFLISLCLGILIGGVTFTGSLVAWGKLSGKMKDFTLPFQQVINVLVMVAILVLWVLVVIQCGGTWPIIISLAALSLIYGGADMPVAIALLNSFSGMAGIFAGFLINNNAMIIAGILVGSSGVILSIMMCNAMNRSLMNVLIGNFGKSGAGAAAAGNLRGAMGCGGAECQN